MAQDNSETENSGQSRVACSEMLAWVVGPSLAQDAGATITTTTGSEYDQYLVDWDGRALYLFTADNQG